MVLDALGVAAAGGGGPTHPDSPGGGWGGGPSVNALSWRCAACTFEHSKPNEQDFLSCALCGTIRRSSNPPTSSTTSDPALPPPPPRPPHARPVPPPTGGHSAPSRGSRGDIIVNVVLMPDGMAISSFYMTPRASTNRSRTDRSVTGFRHVRVERPSPTLRRKRSCESAIPGPPRPETDSQSCSFRPVYCIKGSDRCGFKPYPSAHPVSPRE